MIAGFPALHLQGSIKAAWIINPITKNKSMLHYTIYCIWCTL